MHAPDQYLLDFTSRANERCSRVIALRQAPLPVEMTQGRVEGVIELVQRLALLCRDLPDSMTEPFCVDAQVVAIAARIDRRRTVSEKTIRNWTADAKLLGILTVCYASQQYGGSRWNRYTVDFARVIELTTARVPTDRSHRGHTVESALGTDTAKPGGNGRKRAVTVSDPGAEAVTDPTNVFTNVKSNHSPPLTPDARSSSHRGHTVEAALVVVSDSLEDDFQDVFQTQPDAPDRDSIHQDLTDLGMSPEGARGAVARALARGLTHARIGELVQQYREAAASDPRMTAGWLYRWLTGQSSPPKPSGAAPKPPQTLCGGRGDGLTRSQVDSERRRFQIIRQGRIAGLSDDQIRQRCQQAGVEF